MLLLSVNQGKGIFVSNEDTDMREFELLTSGLTIDLDTIRRCFERTDKVVPPSGGRPIGRFLRKPNDGLTQAILDVVCRKVHAYGVYPRVTERFVELNFKRPVTYKQVIKTYETVLDQLANHRLAQKGAY